MNGVHDMGGMHGFGRIEPEVDEPVFHREWEGRVFALNLTTPLPGGLRPAIEAMEPAEYLRSSYYEKWLHAKIAGLTSAGLITAEEMQEKLRQFRADPAAELRRVIDASRVEEQRGLLAGLFPPGREPDGTPGFRAGDAVRARIVNPRGHTRLPRYVRGRAGTVDRLYGWHEVQDQEPPGVTRPGVEPVYSVRFEGAELWGESAEANSAVYVDMWESYLEPARPED